MARTAYPTFLNRVHELNEFLARRRASMETRCGIAAGSAQDTHLTALQSALAAFTPANGWPEYVEHA